jgi:hypothetical protein
MLTHVICDLWHADAGEEVDTESCRLWIVSWHEIDIILLHGRFFETFDQFLHPKMLFHLSDQDLDEDSRRAGGVLLRHVHVGEAGPTDTVRGEYPAKEAGDVAQPICLVSMD